MEKLHHFQSQFEAKKRILCDTRYLLCTKVWSKIRVELSPLRKLRFTSKNDNTHNKNLRLNGDRTLTPFNGIA